MPQPRQGGRQQQGGRSQERAQIILDTESRQIGSRWYGDAPTGEQVAKWFTDNVRMPEGLKHDTYVQGVTIISQTEKAPEIRDDQLIEVQRLVHVPYVKVETRVAYFWDLCAEKGWLGVIEPVDVPRVDGAGLNNRNLPKGFFRMPVLMPDGRSQTNFVASSMKVSAFVPDLRSGGRGRAVLDAPPAVKQIALLDRWGKPDPYALMKAETGAVGRALGMAGMLVLPGSGVATAEDMHEVLAATGSGAATGNGDDAQLPGAPEADAAKPVEAKDRIAELLARLESEAPEALEQVTAWAAERRPAIKLDAIKPTQERAVLAQLERKAKALDEAAEPAAA